MCRQDQPPIHVEVKGRDNVGKGFLSQDSVLFEGVFRDIPTRTIQLTQSRQDVLNRNDN